MGIVFWTLRIVVLLALIAIVWQHQRYHRIRRDVVHDRQPFLYGASTFHVVTLLELRGGGELFGEVGRFVDAVERGGAKIVYAGKVAFTALVSSQLPETDWDAIVVTQFETRDAYGQLSSSPDYQKTLAGFESHYSMGMDRKLLLNLGIPIAFLGMRALDILKRRAPRYPFQPADLSSADPERLARRERLQAIRSEQELGRDAVCVVNFLKSGNPAQRAANRGYGAEMFGLMAEQAHGPMHIGSAVTLEGDAEFENVAIVYYPGVDYFAQMAQSEFFTGIVGGKQLGDTMATITVPILPQVRAAPRSETR